MRYTCLTEQDVRPALPTLAESVAEYSTRSCFAGSLILDGRVVKQGNNVCITYGNPESGNPDIDTTVYENRSYRSIPSLWKHLSPTSEEIAAATQNGVTPSLPVDIKRSIEFLTAKGNIARFEYPDFFTTPNGDIASLRAWLKDFSEKQWKDIISRESTTSLNGSQIEANSYTPTTALPALPIDWNTLISDAALQKIIQSKNWLHPDITEKSKAVIETSLSYSHQYGNDPTRDPPLLPETGSGYDIAYLGLKSLAPLGAESSESTQTIENNYSTSIAALSALNMDEDGIAAPGSDYQSTAQCGPPDGVMIFQWPSAIICWLGSILPPKISNGSCGGSTIGGKSGVRPSITPVPLVRNDTLKLKSYYDGAKVISHIEKAVMQPQSSQTVMIDFITPQDEHIELPA